MICYIAVDNPNSFILILLSVFSGQLSFLFSVLFSALSLEHTMLHRYLLDKWMRVDSAYQHGAGGTKGFVGAQGRLLIQPGRSEKASWRR